MERKNFQNSLNHKELQGKSEYIKNELALKSISIAMTTYNGEQYIEKQLRSIFNQTLQPKEIVICDDCSKDRTVEIIRALVAEYGAESRVQLVENHKN